MSQPKAAVTWRGARPKGLARVSAHHYQQASWTRDDLTFEQHLPSRSCTCEAGEKGHWCKHLSSAFVAAFVDNLTTARQMEPSIRRKLLAAGTHLGRPDVELALMVSEWETQRDNQNEPPPPIGLAAQADADQAACEDEINAAALDTALTRAGKTWHDLPRRRRSPDAAKIAGWQDHSAELVAQIAAEEGEKVAA